MGIHMKRKIIARFIWGFPVGIAIGYLITICSSLVWAEGYYSPCMPELVSAMGNEIRAVMLQALLCGILGGGCAAGSVIWEIEDWSLVKQTGVYFFVVCMVMMPTAYFMYWMERSAAGFLSYFGIFALMFAFIWIIQFMIGKRDVKKLNENLCQSRKNEKK